MIPKIIHQTHKTSTLPKNVATFPKILKDLHPSWEYRFYDDEACRYFIAKSTPELLHIYDKVRNPIIRSDLFRVAVLFVNGGFYFDTDVFFHSSLDDLLHSCAVFAIESVLDEEDMKNFGHQYAVRIANYGFGFEAGHIFLQYLIRSWLEMEAVLIATKTQSEILEHSGPGFLTIKYHQFYTQQNSEIILLDLPKRICSKCRANRCQFGHYASHLHYGTWADYQPS